MTGEGLRRGSVSTLLGSVLVAVTSLAARAQAVSIPVPNGSFEERASFDPFEEGVDRYNQYALEHWRHFEVDDNGGPLRIWNPGEPGDPAVVPQGIADVGFEGEAPDGDYVVIVRSRYNDDELHDPPQVRDFEAAVQILDEPFDPTRAYTLTVEVGRLPGSDYYTPDWFGYAVQLAVGGTNVDGARFAGRVDGGTVIAEDWDEERVPEDEFVLVTVTYAPEPEHAELAGLPLQIRLAALEDPDDHSLTGWVAFDDVRLESEGGAVGGVFRRGDANVDGAVNLSDAVFVLDYLFTGGAVPACLSSTDFNDSGGASPELSDSVFLLNFLFLGGATPPAPFDECGADPTGEGDDLTCEEFPPCE